MTWLSVLGWITAIVLWIAGLLTFHRTAKANFTPWKWAKRRLVLTGILGSTPIYVLAVHLFPIPLALVVSIALTLLMTWSVVTVLPKRWQRATRKK